MKIKNIGVIGAGYTGIPAAILFAKYYDHVTLFQRNSPRSGYKIDLINSGKLPVKSNEPNIEKMLKDAVTKKKLEATSDFETIQDLDAITIDVQTPFNHMKETPDIYPLLDACRSIGENISEDTLVVLESTVTPGTTEKIVANTLINQSGFTVGKNLFVAHAPERVMVGRLLKNIQEYDRVVGGVEPISTDVAVELYKPLMTKGTIIKTTARTAEVIKTAENAIRDLQIATANQLALYCESMNVNFYDVYNGISSLRGDGVTRALLLPGAGVGGHCLTKDSHLLESGIENIGKFLDFPEDSDSLFESARNINKFMPRHMKNLAVIGLKKLNKNPKLCKVAVLGWSFLPDTDDARNSPTAAFTLISHKVFKEIRIHDPFEHIDKHNTIEQSLENVVENADVIMLFTAHDEYKKLTPGYLKQISGHSNPVFVDGRNLYNSTEFINAGFVYEGIGRGDVNNLRVFQTGNDTE